MLNKLFVGNPNCSLHYLCMGKLYTLFTNASHYAYSGILTKAVDCLKDLRPVAFISNSFLEMQHKWSAIEKMAYAVYQSVLTFDLYLRETNCVLHYDHKPLEPFLSKGIKIPELNRWSMELADHNIKFVHIKGKHNILAVPIPRLKTYNINKQPLENPKVQVVNNMKQVVTEVCANSMHTVGNDTLHNEPKWDNMCKQLVLQICHSNKTVQSHLLCLQMVYFKSTSTFMVCNMT